MNLEQLIQIAIWIHAGLGGLALLAGTTILFLKKGTTRHKLLGRVFFFAMVVSCLFAILISVLPDHQNPLLFGIGIFSTYLLLTGKRAIRYPRLAKGSLGLDKAISWVMLLTAIAMIVGDPLRGGTFNVILGVFGSIGLLFSLRDLSLYRDTDKLKKSGLRLHIGKMMGGYIASVTAFIVVNELIPGILGWILPTVLGSIYISFAMRKFTKGIPPNVSI